MRPGGYTPKQLEHRPTLATGQAADLKIDTGKYRVWLCRVTNRVEYEELINGCWKEYKDE